jgi:hypothetical protein
MVVRLPSFDANQMQAGGKRIVAPWIRLESAASGRPYGGRNRLAAPDGPRDAVVPRKRAAGDQEGARDMVTRMLVPAVGLAVRFLLAQGAFAQGFIDPAQGQTPEQQARDGWQR